MNLEILKIASNTNNQRFIENYSHIINHKNIICGDKIEITIKIKNKKIIDFGYQTKSCIYCQASASLLSRKSIGQEIDNVNDFLKKAEKLFNDEKIIVMPHWNIFKKILQTKNFSRKDCLLLPLNALKKIIKSNCV